MVSAAPAGFDPRPWHWLGDATAAAAASGWRSAMVGLWSAGLWLLQFAFQVVDALTTPDLSSSGPLGAVLPTTLWIGAAVAVVMVFIQITLGVARLDGRSLGRVLVGIAQFGAVWVGYVGAAALLVVASGGLTRGILEQMLDVESLSQVDVTANWPREVTDTTLATVLGVLSVVVIIPAAFMYLVIMLVRVAALLLLTATAPISAGGLLSDVGKDWFWKSNRWFISCLLIAPVAALVVGVGVKVSAGVVAGMGQGDAAAAGTAVVGAIIILVGACCPLVVFRLLAFVEPGTASGAALRQSWSDAGGMAGVMGGSSPGGSAALVSGSGGQSQGEEAAAAQTAGRFGSMFAGLGQSLGAAAGSGASWAQRAADLGSDVLGQAGIGAPGYSMTPTDERSRRGTGQQPGQGGPQEEAPTPRPPWPDPPGPGAGPGPGMPGGSAPGGGVPGAAGPAGGGAGAGAAGGVEGAAAVAAL